MHSRRNIVQRHEEMVDKFAVFLNVDNRGPDHIHNEKWCFVESFVKAQAFHRQHPTVELQLIFACLDYDGPIIE